eukprot:TRINITY_DN41657_c0_g1_i1.p1 TRINITY_DN41657_c0_g1~~TRINITY_DN41657_c0_g1_i1.p1  ORF type:complete len:417 (+),score=78.08 TRINITY_DN41657_c0_g1_i1:40-1251(+)
MDTAAWLQRPPAPERDLEAAAAPSSASASSPLPARPARLRGCAAQAALLALLVAISANDALFKSHSQHLSAKTGRRPYSPCCVVLFTNGVSVLLANVLAVVRRHRDSRRGGSCLDALKQCWSLRSIANMGVPASLFMMSSTMKFIALGFLSAGDVVAIDQCGLLLCAVAGRALLGKHYSTVQWLSLTGVTMSVYWYDRAKRRHESQTFSQDDTVGSLDAARVSGIIIMALAVVLSCLAGISAEVLIKRTKLPFYVSKAHMEVGGTLAALLACLVLEPIFHGSCTLTESGIFGNWDHWTIAVACLTLSKSWLSGLVVHALDNMTLALASTSSMLLVYVEQLLLPFGGSAEAFQPEVCAAVLTLGLAVTSYTVSSKNALAGRKPKSARSALMQPLLGSGSRRKQG